MTRQIFTT